MSNRRAANAPPISLVRLKQLRHALVVHAHPEAFGYRPLTAQTAMEIADAIATIQRHFAASLRHLVLRMRLSEPRMLRTR
jgi:hypothetical protein